MEAVHPARRPTHLLGGRLQALDPLLAPPPPPAPATHACPPPGTPNPPAGPTSGGSGPKQLRGGWECPRTPSQRPICRRSAKSAHGVGHRNPLRAVGLTMSVVFSSHLPIGRMCVVGLAVGRRWGYGTRVFRWCLDAVSPLASDIGRKLHQSQSISFHHLCYLNRRGLDVLRYIDRYGL